MCFCKQLSSSFHHLDTHQYKRLRANDWPSSRHSGRQPWPNSKTEEGRERKKKGEKTPDVIAGESDGSSGFCQVPDGQGLYGKDGDGADFQTCLCPENLYKQSLKKKHQRKFFAFITYRLLISHLTWTTNPLAASQTGPENSSCGMFW